MKELEGLVAMVAMVAMVAIVATIRHPEFESCSCHILIFSLSRLNSNETSIIITHLLIQYDHLIKN